MRENFASEVCEVTFLVQSEVNGAQLIGYDVGKLQQFNPSLMDSVRPWLQIVYLERGQLKSQMVECKGKLWLGGGQAEGKVSRLLRRGLHKLSGLFRGE